MKDQAEKQALTRRGFLRGAGFAVGTAGAVAATSVTRRTEAASGKPIGRPVAGYRESAHVRTAYTLARF